MSKRSCRRATGRRERSVIDVSRRRTVSYTHLDVYKRQGGKPLKKKDLGLMAYNYGYVYVAQVAMGANQLQTLRALREAEAWNGPSLVIAYAPCISHGIRGGLTISQRREKDAVETGYWHLWRYNPANRYSDTNPFTLDSKPPTRPYQDFLKGESRYNALHNRYTRCV